MNYIKTKILIPPEICNDMEKFLQGKCDTFKNYRNLVNSNGYKFRIAIKGVEASEFTILNKNRINIVISIFKYMKRVGKKVIDIMDINKLLLIFDIDNSKETDTSFLLDVEKDVPDTVEFVKSKLKHIIKPNINNNVYVRNYILYANFLNKRDLMNVCFLLLSNKYIIDMVVPTQEIIKSKLNYYGYNLEENKAYSYYGLKDILSSEDAIIKAIKLILFSIDNNVVESEKENICIKMYEDYIDCLIDEGLLLE